MNLKVGDLLADFEVVPPTGKDIFLEDPKNITIQYTYGIICDILDLDEEDRHNLALIQFDKSKITKRYIVLWADHEELFKHYDMEQLEEYKNNVIEIEKEIENDKLK